MLRRWMARAVPTGLVIAALLLLPSDYTWAADEREAARGADEAAAPAALVLQLRWRHQFQFAGYYAALQQGYFADEGLRVTLVEGGPGRSPISEVLDGRAQFGVGSGELLYARLQGRPLVALATIFQHSPSVLMVKRDSGIYSPHDLVGKRVTLTEGGLPIVEIAAMLQREGVSLESVQGMPNHGGIDALLDGVVAADYGYLTNEPYLAREAGLGVQLLRPMDYGVDFYGDTLFTSEQMLADHPDTVAAVRRAVIRGWDYAMAHPQQLIELIRRDYAPGKSVEHLAYEADSLRELIHPELIEVGHINPGRWRRMAETFAELGMLSRPISLEGFVFQPALASDSPWLRWAFWAALITGSVAAALALLLGVFNRRLSAAVAARTGELQSEAERRRAAEQQVMRQNQTLEQTVELRTAELRRAKDEAEATSVELSAAMDGLRSAQQELVQSEKMAALGQLVAGVAHEINTPLGAIQLSVDGVSRFIGTDLKRLPEFMQQLPAALRQPFFALLEGAGSGSGGVETMSSRERRAHRRGLTRELEQAGVADASHLADTLVDMGVIELNPALQQLLASDTGVAVIEAAAGIHQLRRNAATIDTAARRAAKVVFALKTYAHHDHSGEQVATDIGATIETVLTLYHNQMKHGIELRRRFADLPTIPAYPDELNQVWTNLIHNALQAMEHQGVLSIETGMAADEVWVAIADTGPGIPEAQFETVFEPFFTTKASGEGSGLGLDIVRRVVERHRGRIEITAASPHGACFTVRLPMAGNAA